MAKKTTAIDPASRYRIKVATAFEHDGEKYIPRDGVTYKVSGAVLEQIKGNVDDYEVA